MPRDYKHRTSAPRRRRGKRQSPPGWLWLLAGLGIGLFVAFLFYLQQKSALFRWLPSALDWVLDRPWLLRRATARSTAIDPKFLGDLAVSMLRGEHGYQRKEVRRLCRYLASDAQPNLVVLTNMLIGGCIPELRRTLGVPVLVTLQGDDAFLEYLPEPHKTRSFEQIRRLVRDVDGFLVHSRYYAEFMTGYFGIPPDKLHVVPLGIDTRDDAEREFAEGSDPADQSSPDGPEQGAASSRPPTIGYLARLAPEKGLHVLCDAFIELRRWGGLDNVQLRIAGWLGEQNRAYAESLFERLRTAGLGGAFQYVGEVDRPGKREFLRSLDVLSVPTTQREPKGLFVLESLAAGVPVVLPDHGAFPELIASTGGGCLVPPHDPAALAGAIADLVRDEPRRRQYAAAGRQAVHEHRHAEAMARATLDVFQKLGGNKR